MYFIKTIIKKFVAISCKLSAFIFHRLSVKNLPPTTYHLQSSPHHLPAHHDCYRACRAWQPNRGFTLIETLVAISILMIAIASPLTIAQKGVASAIYAKDQIIASYLAQDAIEFIINKSDRNKLDGVVEGWLYGILSASECNLDDSCEVDTTDDGTIKNCSDDGEAGCNELKYFADDTNHFYSYRSGGNPSGFKRSVTVEEVNPNTEALITVKMSWSDKGKHRELTFQTRIFNWK